MMSVMEARTKPNGFAGLRVLSLESRRAVEMAKLIATYGGNAMVAPSMREIPLESNKEAQSFTRALVAGSFDMVIFLTGVGTRALARVAETVCTRDEFVLALQRVPIVARGPKPVAALKELGVPVALAVPEPNTWRELLAALDGSRDTLPLGGKRVAVQEYGAPNADSWRDLPSAAPTLRKFLFTNGGCRRIPRRCARRPPRLRAARWMWPYSRPRSRSYIC